MNNMEAEITQFEKRILLVEDETVIAMSIEEALNNIGYSNVDMAFNVKSAIDLLENNTFDLTILDINLNDEMDGIEIAEIIKEKNQDMPIIFLTGNSDDLTVAKAKKVEPNVFLIKPFGESELKINLDIIFFQQSNQSTKTKKIKETKLIRDFFLKNPNLILRVGLGGELLLVNHYIERISGNPASFYENKTIYTADYDDDFIECIEQGLELVKKKGRNAFFDTSIQTIMGERMMSVLVIPEKIVDDKLNSVAIVFQDITDQKISSNDLHQKNRKITDSINYSKKLQDALLPDNVKLQQYLPDANILLRSKDIVGGDFPWLFKKSNFLYIAAVDCTGHGVPGSLISIIVHFLLNEIVKTNEDLTPGKMLEILHVQLKRTLKQHLPDITINDGADIALSRIDIVSNTLSFSGAHRPLILKRDNEIIELKGDRQPVGGMQYSKKKKQRLRFINHSMQLEKGDSFLMFSDGLTDQFGGNDQPLKKYGLKRVKDILLESSGTAKEISATIEADYNAWKGGNHQIDDVILISINA